MARTTQNNGTPTPVAAATPRTRPADRSETFVSDGAGELRMTLSIGEEKTEYTVVGRGSVGTTLEYNVSPAHDPNGGFVLDKNYPTKDAAIAAFTKLFKGGDVIVNGGGEVWAVVNDEKVLAVADTKASAMDAAAKLAEGDGKAPEDGGTGGVTGSVHPASRAVKTVFDQAGTEGTRIIVNKGGLVTLAY